MQNIANMKSHIAKGLPSLIGHLTKRNNTHASASRWFVIIETGHGSDTFSHASIFPPRAADRWIVATTYSVLLSSKRKYGAIPNNSNSSEFFLEYRTCFTQTYVPRFHNFEGQMRMEIGKTILFLMLNITHHFFILILNLLGQVSDDVWIA